MSINEDKKTYTDVSELLKKLKSLKKPQQNLYIQADRDCPYGKVMQLLSGAEKNGFSQFQLVNTTENS